MGFKGDLSSFHLSDVFQTLSMSQKEGTLVIEDGSAKKCIFFGRGAVRLLATGTRASAPMGETLIDHGVITANQLQIALANSKQSGRRLGEVLLVMGFVEQEQIDKLVRAQIEEEVYDLFWWKSAQFEFIDGPPSEDLADPTARPTLLAFDVNTLLFEAARRLDEWEKMRQAIPDFTAVLLLTDDARAELEAGHGDPRTQRVLGMCDGSRTVQQVCDQARMGRFEPFRILYEAVHAARLRVALPDDLRTAARRFREVGDPVRALAVARSVAGIDPEDLEVLGMVAELEAEAGEGKAASQTFLKLASKHKVLGEAEKALAMLERATAADPANIDAGLAFCRQCADAGRQEQAEQAVKPLIPPLLAAGRAEEARELCSWAAGLSREPVDLRVLQAQATLRLKNPSLAMETLRQALAGFPGGDRRKAEKLLKRVRALTPQETELIAAVEGMIEKNQQGRLALKVGALTVLVLAGMSGAGLWYRQQDAAGRAIFEAARQAADPLVAGKKWDEARAVYRGVETKLGLGSGKDLLRLALAEIQRLQTEESRRRFLEQRDLESRRVREAGERKSLLDEAEVQEREGADLEVPLATFRDAETWARSEQHPELEVRARAGRERIEKHLAEARALAENVAARLAEGKLEESRAAVRKLWQQYPRTASARDTSLPVQVVSYPPGAFVKVNRTDAGKSPVVVPLGYGVARAAILVESPGFLPLTQEITADSEAAVVAFHLEKLVAWRHRTKGTVEGRPALKDDRVVFGSRDGRLYAVRIASGDLIWAFEAGAGGDFIGAPVIQGDSVYAGSNDQKLYRIELETGKKKWEYTAGQFIQGAPLVLDDLPIVAVGSQDQKLHGVHRETGRGVWTVPTNGPISGQPVYHAGSILFGSEDGKLRAVDPANGKVLWQIECGAEIVAAPGLEGTRAYVPTKSGQVHCVDLVARKIVWTHQAGGAILHPPVAAADGVFFGCLDGSVRRLKPEDGALSWTFTAPGAVAGGVARFDGSLVFGSRDGSVIVLDASNGIERWRLKTRGPVNGAPVVEGGLLFIGSDDGQLYAAEVR